MKKFKKCFSALFLSCFLAFGNVSGCYLEVQAFEWILPTITIEEALPWLLGLLGVYVGAEAGQEVDWGQLKDDCIQFQENQGNSAVAVSQWWSDILSGSLSQVSECWTSFKNWVYSLTLKSNSSISNNYFSGTNIDLFNSITDFSFSWTIPSDMDSYNLVHSFAYYSVNMKTNKIESLVIYNNVNVFVDSVSNSNTVSFYVEPINNYSEVFSYDANHKNAYKPIPRINSRFKALSIDNSSGSYTSYFILPLFNYDYSFISNNRVNKWASNGNIIDSFKNELINDFSLAMQNAISSAIPDVIPLPWDVIGDSSEAIQKELDKLYDLVATGVLDLSGFMERIQNLLKVYTLDTTSSNVLIPERPNPDTGEDESFDDKVEENQGIDGTFVLSGFEKVFPFCIPFDVYAFITLLVADPVAPVINWPVYNPISGNNEIITIDFSAWENVVILFRYIFDFLFIIGLLLSARALIGGGDKA